MLAQHLRELTANARARRELRPDNFPDLPHEVGRRIREDMSKLCEVAAEHCEYRCRVATICGHYLPEDDHDLPAEARFLVAYAQIQGLSVDFRKTQAADDGPITEMWVQW